MFLEQETLDLFVHKVDDVYSQRLVTVHHKVDVYSQRLVTAHHSRNVVLVLVEKISKWRNLIFS